MRYLFPLLAAGAAALAPCVAAQTPSHDPPCVQTPRAFAAYVMANSRRDDVVGAGNRGYRAVVPLGYGVVAYVDVNDRGDDGSPNGFLMDIWRLMPEGYALAERMFVRGNLMADGVNSVLDRHIATLHDENADGLDRAIYEGVNRTPTAADRAFDEAARCVIRARLEKPNSEIDTASLHRALAAAQASR